MSERFETSSTCKKTLASLRLELAQTHTKRLTSYRQIAAHFENEAVKLVNLHGERGDDAETFSTFSVLSPSQVFERLLKPFDTSFGFVRP